MKRMVKSGLPFVMSLCMVMSSMSVPADIDAAKKIKLSKKSVTVTKGKSKTVAIKNVKAKKVKKLVVKSSKKKTVAAKKSGKTKVKVTGKKVGNAKVTVKLTLKGKKKAVKLTLKVKVKSAAKKPGTGQTAAPGTSQTTAPGSTQTAVPGGTQTAAPGGTQTAAPSPSAGTDKTPAPSAGTADTPTPSAGTDKTPTPSAGTDKTPAPSASVTDGKTYELPLTAENVKADGDSSAVSFKDSTAVIKVTGKYSGVILTMPAGVAGEYDMVTVSYKGGNGKCGSALRKDGTDQDIRWGGQFPATETVKEVQHISTSGTVNGYKIFCNEEDLATNPLEITITKVVFSNSKDLPPTPAPSAGADNTPAPSAGAADTPAPSAGAADTPAPSAGADNTPAPSAGAADTPTPSAGAAGTPTPPVQLEPGEEEIDGVVCKTYPMVETMDYEIVKPGVETEKIELPLTELPNLLNKITDLAGTYSKWMGTVEYSKTVNGVSFDITTEDEDHMETKKVVVSGSVNDRLNGEFEVSVEKKAEAVYQVKITKDGAAEPRTLTITKNSDRVIIESTYNGTAYKVDAANDKKTITVYTDGTTLLGKLMKTEGEGAYKLALSKEEVEKRGLKVQESTKQDIPPQPETEIMAEVTLADTAVIAGETTEATAEITVIGSTAEKQITWSSLNENVATVAPKADDPAKAIVTAKEAGTATIKVTVEAGGKSQEATVAINVKEALTVTGGAIKVPDQPIFVGKTAQLKVEGITTNGTISKTEWTVDAADQAKAEIGKDTGVLTAKKADVTIAVKAKVTVTGELEQTTTHVIDGTVQTAPAGMLDLSADSSVETDGQHAASVKPKYNKATGCLDVEMALFSGVIFKAPDDGNAYKFAKITYTSDGAVNAYTFDENIEDGGHGMTPAGQQESNGLALATEEKTAVYQLSSKHAGTTLTALKFVDVRLDQGASVNGPNLHIKSIEFLTELKVDLDFSKVKEATATDGTIKITENKEMFGFDLDPALNAGDKVKVNVEGTFDEGATPFRILFGKTDYLGNGDATDAYRVDVSTTEDRNISVDTTVTVKDEQTATHIVFKGLPTWEGGTGNMNNLTFTKITLTYL